MIQRRGRSRGVQAFVVLLLFHAMKGVKMQDCQKKEPGIRITVSLVQQSCFWSSGLESDTRMHKLRWRKGMRLAFPWSCDEVLNTLEGQLTICDFMLFTWASFSAILALSSAFFSSIWRIRVHYEWLQDVCSGVRSTAIQQREQRHFHAFGYV